MRTIFVSYRVTDLEHSLAFYTAIGYVELGRIGDDADRLVLLRFPGEPVASLELAHRPGDGPVVIGSGFDHLAISVDRLSDTVARLTAAGLEPGPPQAPGGADGPRVCWITDPDGYRIELVEWPAGHPDGITPDDFG